MTCLRHQTHRSVLKSPTIPVTSVARLIYWRKRRKRRGDLYLARQCFPLDGHGNRSVCSDFFLYRHIIGDRPNHRRWRRRPSSSSVSTESTDLWLRQSHPPARNVLQSSPSLFRNRKNNNTFITRATAQTSHIDTRARANRKQATARRVF